MMTDRELMQQALKALETNNKAWTHLADSGDAGFWEVEEQPFYEINVKTIAALRERLAQAKQEPVAYMYPVDFEGIQKTQTHAEVMTKKFANLEICIPLYTAPRQWQGLMDDEIAEAGHLNVEGERMLPYSFARAIEAKLKEKNNGQ